MKNTKNKTVNLNTVHLSEFEASCALLVGHFWDIANPNASTKERLKNFREITKKVLNYLRKEEVDYV